MADFELLSSKAYNPDTGKPGSKEDLDALWRSLFELEYWHFLIHPDKPMQPHIIEFDEQTWVLVFTDNAKLNAYARAHNIVTPDKKSMSMSIPCTAAREWLNKGNAHVYGVRFNQGEFGWFAPIESLTNIYNYLFSI